MSRTFHEIFLLGRILQGNFFPCKILARCLAEKCIILQDLERKSCKILARNAFFLDQGSYKNRFTRLLKMTKYEKKTGVEKKLLRSRNKRGVLTFRDIKCILAPKLNVRPYKSLIRCFGNIDDMKRILFDLIPFLNENFCLSNKLKRPVAVKPTVIVSIIE